MVNVSFMVLFKIRKFHVADYPNTRLSPRIRNISFHVIELSRMIIHQAVINLPINDNLILINPVGNISLLKNNIIGLIDFDLMLFRVFIPIVYSG